MVLVDGLTLRVDVDVRPIFLHGRYRKVSRGIPQTRWPCRACRGGRGMRILRGNRAPVRRLRAGPNRRADQGGSGSRGHLVPWNGQGRHRCPLPGIREAIRARNKTPTQEKPPNEGFGGYGQNARQGKVEVDELSWCTRKKVNEVKQSRSEKTYTIRFRAEGIDDEKKAREAILSLSGQVIDQETP